jgi:hypothetical protein
VAAALPAVEVMHLVEEEVDQVRNLMVARLLTDLVVQGRVE